MSVIEAGPRSNTVWLDDDGLLRSARAWVALPDNEWRIVAMLLQRKGHVVGRDDLVQAVWPGKDVSPGAPRSHHPSSPTGGGSRGRDSDRAWPRFHPDHRSERIGMKLITAIVKPFKLDDVKQALHDGRGSRGMTVSASRSVRTTARPHRGLPRRRVHRRLRAEGAASRSWPRTTTRSGWSTRSSKPR